MNLLKTCFPGTTGKHPGLSVIHAQAIHPVTPVTDLLVSVSVAARIPVFVEKPRKGQALIALHSAPIIAARL